MGPKKLPNVAANIEEWKIRMQNALAEKDIPEEEVSDEEDALLRSVSCSARLKMHVSCIMVPVVCV